MSWHDPEKVRPADQVELPEWLGRRIAGLRTKMGLTQADVAARLGMSRTAVSHLEAGMSVASERTVILLASLFKVDPPELIAGTDYPLAKAERLPARVARHTEIDLLLALAQRDVAWRERVGPAEAAWVRVEWDGRLADLAAADVDVDPAALKALHALVRRLA